MRKRKRSHLPHCGAARLRAGAQRGITPRGAQDKQRASKSRRAAAESERCALRLCACAAQQHGSS